MKRTPSLKPASGDADSDTSSRQDFQKSGCSSHETYSKTGVLGALPPFDRCLRIQSSFDSTNVRTAASVARKGAETRTRPSPGYTAIRRHLTRFRVISMLSSSSMRQDCVEDNDCLMKTPLPHPLHPVAVLAFARISVGLGERIVYFRGNGLRKVRNVGKHLHRTAVFNVERLPGSLRPNVVLSRLEHAFRIAEFFGDIQKHVVEKFLPRELFRHVVDTVSHHSAVAVEGFERRLLKLVHEKRFGVAEGKPRHSDGKPFFHENDAYGRVEIELVGFSAPIDRFCIRAFFGFEAETAVVNHGNFLRQTPSVVRYVDPIPPAHPSPFQVANGGDGIEREGGKFATEPILIRSFDEIRQADEKIEKSQGIGQVRGSVGAPKRVSGLHEVLEPLGSAHDVGKLRKIPSERVSDVFVYDSHGKVLPCPKKHAFAVSFVNDPGPEIREHVGDGTVFVREQSGERRLGVVWESRDVGISAMGIVSFPYDKVFVQVILFFLGKVRRSQNPLDARKRRGERERLVEFARKHGAQAPHPGARKRVLRFVRKGGFGVAVFEDGRGVWLHAAILPNLWITDKNTPIFRFGERKTAPFTRAVFILIREWGR